MNTSTSRGFARRPVMALAAAVTLVLGFSAPVHQAQAWIPVQETGVSLINHIMNQINTWSQKYQDIDAYRKQWTQIQALYVRLQTLMQLQFNNNVSLTKVDENEGVNERCGEGASGALGAALSVIKPNAEGDIMAEQRKICVARQIAMNRKYNVAVDMMAVLKKHAEEFNSIERQRMTLSGDKPGENQGVTNTMQSFGNRVEQDLNNFEMTIKAYDNYIAALNDRQQVLAQQALKGKNGEIGKVVGTTILQGALTP